MYQTFVYSYQHNNKLTSAGGSEETVRRLLTKLPDLEIR